MNRLEDDLRAALRRREPPDGFAARVFGRLDSERGRRRGVPTSRGRRWFWWVAAAAAALALLGGPLAEYRYRRHGEAARDQAMLALRIASTQLNGALKKVVELHPVRPRNDDDGRSE